jgi:tRNA(adenine34) deaminase
VTTNASDHEKFMREALRLARKAYDEAEAPVGAIVVLDGKIVGRGYNRRESANDPTRHAEIDAIRAAARKLGSWRLLDCDLYVTLEPCTMCAGAIIQARMRKVFYGASDPKAGAAGSVIDVFAVETFNHKVDVEAGLLSVECGAILTNFFRARRGKTTE